MFKVFAVLVAGVLAGYLMRRIRVRWMGKVTMVLIWILLLLLGIEVGGDRRIMESLPTLGLEAAVIAVVTALGSCLMAWLLWRMTARKRDGKSEEGEDKA